MTTKPRPRCTIACSVGGHAEGLKWRFPWLIGLVLWSGIPLGAAVATAQSVPQPSTAIEVTGHGATRWEARSAAIRAALQQSVSQLVFADRKVAGDSLVRDDVATTLNGFVERFEVVRESVQADGHAVTARVWVSQREIARYLAVPSSGTAATVRGDEMLASLQAERMRRAARAEMVARLFEGYPYPAMDLRVVGIDTKRSDGVLALDVRGAVAEGFVARLTEGLAAIGQEECVASRGCRPFQVQLIPPNGGRNSLWRGRTRVIDLGDVDDSRADGFMADPDDWHARWGGGTRENGLRALAFTEHKARMVTLRHVGESGSISYYAHACDDYSGLLFGRVGNGSSPICLFVGEHSFLTEVPASFFEGAESIRLVLFDGCGFLDSTYREGVTPSLVDTCVTRVEQLTGLSWRLLKTDSSWQWTGTELQRRR